MEIILFRIWVPFIEFQIRLFHQFEALKMHIAVNKGV